MIISFFLLLLHANQKYSTAVNIPFFKQFKPNLLIEPLTRSFWTYPLAFVLFYGFIVFVMVGSSNAVNLTDGLDGLAIGLMIIAAGAMTALYLRLQQYCVLGLSRSGAFARLSGTHNFLLFDDRRKSRFSLVQLSPGGSIHG